MDGAFERGRRSRCCLDGGGGGEFGCSVGEHDDDCGSLTGTIINDAPLDIVLYVRR